MHDQGFGVTRRERRQKRDRDNQQFTLHQNYLKQVADQVGIVDLGKVSKEDRQRVELEKIYVDSPTGLRLRGEVNEWDIVEWWINDQGSQEEAGTDSEGRGRQPTDMGYESAPLEYLIGQVSNQIQQYREEHPEAKVDDYGWNNPWANQSNRALLDMHLGHIASVCDRLVILGNPGSGKSVFVKYLALCLAGAGIQDWTREVNVTGLGSWTHGDMTPVYIELRQFVTSKHFQKEVTQAVTADDLWAYITQEILGEGLGGYAQELALDLEQGHGVLILDGLDEVPYPEGKLSDRQDQLIGLAQSLNTRFGKSRIIVASRPYGYEGWTLPGYKVVTIQAYEDSHRVALTRRLFQITDMHEAEASKGAKEFNRQLVEREVDEELRDRPLFVTLMARIYLKGEKEGLPTRRGALYRRSIYLLMDRWTQSKPKAESLLEILGDEKVETLYQRLGELAYKVHEEDGEQEGTPDVKAGLIYECLLPFGGVKAAKLISYLSENAGVLISPGQDKEKNIFRFAHRSFQEYLAAVHIVQKCGEKEDGYGRVGDHIGEKPQLWREVCKYVGDVVEDTLGRSQVWDLVEDVIAERTGEEDETSRWWRGWLASEILQKQRLMEKRTQRISEKAIVKEVAKELIVIITTPEALYPGERAGCGQGLSTIGDPRVGVGTKKIQVKGEEKELPEIEWCPIPAPESRYFVMGSEDEKDNPRREVAVGYDYQMAKYPVTYAQYRVFAETEAYENPKWWELFPEKYRVQKLIDQRYKYENHPRDGVSWYQAVAYGKWLTVAYREAGLIGDREEIRLPREEEWEYAARGEDERTYPWGNEYLVGYANVDEQERGAGPHYLNRSTTVGLYPQGASPFGVQDMSGNLWEWCLNDYGSPDVTDGYANGARKVLRGGSWSYFHYDSRSVCRYRRYPLFRLNYLGFRVVLAPLS